MQSLQNSAPCHVEAAPTPPAPAFAQWSRNGQELYEVGEENEWKTGAWLLSGMERFPDRYGHEAIRIGFNWDRLRQKAWVCKQVPKENRRRSLSFSHHEAVASLSPGDQKKFLELAVEKDWGREELREAVSLHKGYDQEKKPAKSKLSFDEALSTATLTLRQDLQERPLETWSRDERLRLKLRIEPWALLYQAL